QFSKNYLVAHLRLPYVNIFVFRCQLSFSISFLSFSAFPHQRRLLIYHAEKRNATSFENFF
ncbi:hypothetical protein, partial [Bacillus paramycoides]|uniref:hypothetical protein n=1 Tax=Bacillus paramycoides TaxID=2026194 RepID=UPI002E21AF9B|nr:hypothetical protein [Bacillus paramycoides]